MAGGFTSACHLCLTGLVSMFIWLYENYKRSITSNFRMEHAFHLIRLTAETHGKLGVSSTGLEKNIWANKKYGIRTYFGKNSVSIV